MPKKLSPDLLAFNPELLKYEVAQLQENVKEIKAQIADLDKSNAEGFKAVHEKLDDRLGKLEKGLAPLTPLAQKVTMDSTRIDRLEKGLVGAIVVFAIACVGFIWSLITKKLLLT
jgi:cell division protein FtsL